MVIDWHCSSIRRGKTTFVDASKLAGELSEQACNSLVVDNKKVYWPAAALEAEAAAEAQAEVA